MEVHSVRGLSRPRGVHKLLSVRSTNDLTALEVAHTFVRHENGDVEQAVHRRASFEQIKRLTCPDLGVPIVGVRTDIPLAMPILQSISCTEFVKVPRDQRTDVAWVADRIVESLKQLSVASQP